MSNIKKVYVIDDDKMMRHMIVDTLSDYPQFEVKQYETGELALKDLLQDVPSFVILDYTLNSENSEAANGLDVLLEIKKRLSDVHVIMLSSQSKYGLAVQTLTKGAEHYLIKDENTFKNLKSVLDSYN